ncbi:hypothetical protein [Caldivirga sp.]|jgi:hypothetical protein|uniref:hypothetical protein n=1 Tax=Caldivirga sp. TaxID=2080243 RepID=UPI003D12CBEA
MRRLTERELKALKQCEDELRSLERIRKTGVKVSHREATSTIINREAGSLAKYCTSPNRRLCNEALRLILTRLNPSQVEDALRQLKTANYPPEVAVAYMAGAVLVIMGKAKYDGIIIQPEGSIDLEPVLTGQFTIEHARRILPLNEPGLSALEALIRRITRRP